MHESFGPNARTLLRLAGVLMIVFGTLCVLIYLLGLAGVFALSYATGGIFSANSDLIGMGLFLAAAVTELIAGILGVRAAKRPQRAGKGMLVWTALFLVLSVAGIVLIAVRSTTIPLWEPIVALVLSAVLPVFYFVVAAKLLSPERQDAEEPAAE